MAKPVPSLDRCSNNHLLEKLGADIKHLHDDVFIKKQEKGEDTTCSEQIYKELSGLLKDTCDANAIQNRLRFFEESLRSTPAEQGAARQQQPMDGSWGLCVEQWYWKVAQSIDYFLSSVDEGFTPPYRFSFLDKINSPQALRQYLDRIKITDQTLPSYVDHRKELNEGGTTLLRFILTDIPGRNYQFDPKLRDVMLNYLKKWQNPETGYWGAWYKDANGITKMDDLSITYHIIAYLKRAGVEVGHWGKIFETTLRMKDKPYPNGWLEKGKRYSNHHNFDVVKIFRIGWKFKEVSDHQRRWAQAEIKLMLIWSLKQSLNKDGSFETNGSYTENESMAYGVKFLNEVGYFNPKKLFWITQKEWDRLKDDFELPDPQVVAQLISNRLKGLNPNNEELNEARAILQGFRERIGQK